MTSIEYNTKGFWDAKGKIKDSYKSEIDRLDDYIGKNRKNTYQ